MGSPKYTPNSSYCFTDSVMYLDHRWLQSLATEYGDYAVGFVIAHECHGFFLVLADHNLTVIG